MNPVINYLFLFLLSLPLCYGSSWNQWRGSDSNGKVSTDIKLNKKWTEEEPKVLWESEEIPSQDYGGFGSVISNKDQVFLSLVWHRDVPTQTRVISDLVLRKISARKVNLPSEIIKKAEADRLSLSPRLRGTKLDQWIDDWVKENLSFKQALTTGDLIASRFKKGKLAMPIDVINKLHEIKNKVFPNQEALDNWLSEQNFNESIIEKVSQEVPPTMQVAEDVVISLDLSSGSVIWKTSLKSVPTGRKSSSTPCVINGKVYAIGSERIYCLDSKTGTLIWDQKLPTQEIASSILPHQNKVIVLAGNLRAYDQENGSLLWENHNVKGKAASPSTWKLKEKEFIVCNSNKSVVVIDPEDGKTFWEGPGGGSSTPVSQGNLLLVHAKPEEFGLIAYQFANGKISELWRIPKLTRRTDSSPLLDNGYAYLIGAGMRLCVKAESGEVVRKIKAKHDISSPLIADDKILAYEINGNFLMMIDANHNNFEEIQKAKINALKCTSPSLTGTKLLVRTQNKIICLELGNSGIP